MNKCNADINFKKEGDKMSINKSILDFTENYGDICKHNDYIPQTLLMNMVFKEVLEIKTEMVCLPALLIYHE